MPYRTATLVVPPSPWLRSLAAMLPLAIGARWQWYRRTRGGRWALCPVRVAPMYFAWGWYPVSECPGETNYRMMDPSNIPPKTCWRHRLEIDSNPIYNTGRCFCETHP